MEIDKLTPRDPRVQHFKAAIRGKTYGYLLAEPSGPPIDTIILVHGFPDFSFGWRYQIPHLHSLGYKIIAPDALGYATTDAPEERAAYTTTSVADDIAELARHVVGPDTKVIVGGHDMGGQTAWQVAAAHPQLVKAVFSVCTPVLHVSDTYSPLEDMIAAGKWTHFGYQLQFKGPDVEERIQGADKIRQFLNAMYGGTTPDGEHGISLTSGAKLDILPQLGQTPLLSEAELDYYVENYMLRAAPQMRGPLNYYRVQDLDWADGLARKQAGVTIDMPALFIGAAADGAVPPSLADGMGKIVRNVKIDQVQAGHWALWQAPAAINKKLETWLIDVVQKI
ncbi:hypothetical protein PWT90_00681 [Aphanocladium album]|nr:hypothetical protein PWT90_00681 [Aphanocladium album]